MKFGLDANIAYPPFSVIYSILLIFGCDFLGFYILKLFESQLGEIKNTWRRWQAPLTGGLLLSVSLYPLALFGLTPRLLMKNVAFFLVILGLINLRNFIKKIKSDKDIFTDSKQNFDRSFNFNIPSDLQQEKNYFSYSRKNIPL